MTLKLIPYKELITKAKELKDEALAPIRAKEMRKQAELEQMKIEADIVTQEAKIQELASAYPIDYGKMFDAMDELALKRRRHKQFDDIIQQMFAEDK